MITDINDLHEGAILYWHRDNNEHMLGRVTSKTSVCVYIHWYLDTTGEIEEYDDEYQLEINAETASNLLGYIPWLEYTSVITEQEQFLILLKHSSGSTR